jgi:predicted lipoprotein with Yx(FWY)xxD motif
MRQLTVVVILLFVAVTIAAYGEQEASRPAAVNVRETPVGQILTDANGMTLYTFDNDKTAGESACNGPCAQNWPPLMAPADAQAMGNWSVVSRSDGSKQWALNGKPLYTFIKDTQPGDMNGDGFKDLWHIAKP